jgi:DNA-binding IclR family transcriptional regulator
MAGGSTEWRGRSVISKVAALLDAFTAATPELTLGELAQRTGLPVSTTYRLVSELVDWGGLERVPGGGYRIGLRMWEVGALAPRGETLRAVALPYMSDLYEATLENVHLAVLDGSEVLYVEKLSGRRAMPVRTRRGGRLPLHATAAGKVLLAYAPENLFRETVAAGLRRYTAHTIIAPGLLRRALTEIRRSGIGYAREELTVGSHSVASAVLDADGAAVAALSVTLRSGRTDLRRLGPAVRTAAISVSRGLQQRALLTGERADRAIAATAATAATATRGGRSRAASG